MALRTNCRMRTFFVVVLLALVMVQEANAFVKGSAHTNSRPILFTGRTQLAATKKKAAKKTAAKKKKQEPKIEVETIRKAEIISSVAGKLECTKSEAESALAAVLGTISEVCYWIT